MHTIKHIIKIMNDKNKQEIDKCVVKHNVLHKYGRL